jgi:hypothetical protein
MSNLYLSNDNLLSVENLKNAATSVYINDATVTATLKDKLGVNVVGQSWPLTLGFVASSNGVYRGTLEDGLSLTEGETYTAEINADAGSDQIANWSIQLTATKRTS